MTAEKILEIARREIGVTEYPPKTNNVKYNTAYWGYECYGDEAYPWCMAFVWWVFREAGAEELILKTASCPSLARWAQGNDHWITSGFKPGDVLLYRFTTSTGYEHVGILEKVNADGTYTAIEGNTSLTSNDNGGAVMRRTRYKSNIVGAYRPDYKEENDMTRKDTEKLIEEKITEAIGSKADFQAYLAKIVKEATEEEIYNTIEEVPAYWREDIRELVNKGIIQGVTETELGLSYTHAKCAVIAKRIAERYIKEAAERMAGK